MKMKKSKMTVIASAVITVFLSIVGANALIPHFALISGTANVSPAPEILQQSWLEGNATSCSGVYHNCDNENLDKNISQSFIPSKNGLITKAGVFLTRHSGSSSVDLTVQIRTNTNSTCKSGSTNCPSTTILATGTIPSFTGSSDDYTWKNVTFSSPVMLTSGQIYHIVINSVGGNSYRWAKDKTSPFYPNGQEGSFSASQWTMSSSESLIFKVFMQVGP